MKCQKQGIQVKQKHGCSLRTRHEYAESHLDTNKVLVELRKISRRDFGNHDERAPMAGHPEHNCHMAPAVSNRYRHSDRHDHAASITRL
jgi:hypothetical protein